MTFMMGPFAELVDDVDAFFLFPCFLHVFPRIFLSKGLLRVTVLKCSKGLSLHGRCRAN
jgi:hypothetical protein